MLIERTEDVSKKLLQVVSAVQKLDGNEVEDIDVTANLVEESDMDLLAAFEFVVLVHEAMGVPLPEDVNLGAVETIQGMADFVVDRYPLEAVDRLLRLSPEEIEDLASQASDDDF